MPKLGVLFDIDALGGGLYGHAAYQAFFGCVDTRQLGGCVLSDGDTNATLSGRANHYCIAVESPDASKISLVKEWLSRSTAGGLLPVSSRFLDDALVQQEPLVVAAQIDFAGELVGCQTGWVTAAWKESLGKRQEQVQEQAQVSRLEEASAIAYCPQCGNRVAKTDPFCPKCGARQATDSRAVSRVPVGQPLSWVELQHVYSPIFDVAKVPHEQLERFKRHWLDSTFPTAMAVVLHFFTLGLFTVIFHGLKHSRLPVIRHDDFRAGKAIGFLFIPFYNFYWFFVFWLRLADRVNFQFRLRNQPDAVSRGLVMTACILTLIPYIGLIAFLVLYPIISGQIQSACNRLTIMEAPYRI